MLKKFVEKIYNKTFEWLGIKGSKFEKKVKKIVKYAINLSGCIRNTPTILYILFKKNLSYSWLKKKKYSLLLYLSKINIGLWKQVSKLIFQTNLSYLSRKKSKIKVAFLCNLSATWSCDKLYNILLNSEKFDPYIIVHHFYNGTPKTIEEAVNEAYNFFENKGYKVLKDKDENGFLDLQSLGNPEVIFHLSPYNDAFPKTLNIVNFPLNTININIPYGIYVADLAETQYQINSFSMFWKIFDLPFYCKTAHKYTRLGDFNRVGSGYCKLDSLYECGNESTAKYWKGSGDRPVRIIYAPHHSMKEKEQKFSTFDKNYKKIYELAKNLSDSTSWVIKPHPLLKKASIEAGVFKTEDEFDEYLRAWENLSNANVVLGGDYFELFKSSDCMILDSDSFLAEYLYVNKPMLLLTRETQKFSELGKPLVSTLYKAEGEDIIAIERFIHDVVIEGDDYLKEKRQTYFDEYLNYMKENGKIASEFIYEYLCEALRVHE